MAQDDTIVATATAPGEAAIAVTRLSGPDALAIAARHFRGARSPLETPSHRILFGTMVDAAGAPLDTVLLSLFRSPHSYTGEDVAEISSHGGTAIPRAILETLVRAGARPARPGEFTERAFRNGKIDLAQAESVAAVVRARSDRAARAARAALGGALTKRIESLDTEMVSLLAEVESRIDFPGDVREAADVGAMAARCRALADSIRDWIARIPSARRRDAGIGVAILGAPNVGKSSLLNALVGFDRAIVSETPGTTRDTIEASIWLDGIEICLVDTAGVRIGAEAVERMGIERTRQAADSADLAIVVRDCTRPKAGAEIEATLPRTTPRLIAWNKSDLAPPAPDLSCTGTVIETVAVRTGGVDALVEALRAALPPVVGDASADEIPTTSARQESLLREALEALERAEVQLLAGTNVEVETSVSVGGPIHRGPDPAAVAYDLAAVDLTDARRALGEVIGRGVDDAVIAAVFQRFCIGK